MWSLMLATVVASLLSNSRSTAAEVARFTRASRYSRWWLGLSLHCEVARETCLFGCAKLVTEKALCALEVCFEVSPGLLVVGFGVPRFAIFEVQPRFENKGVRDAEELVGGVGLGRCCRRNLAHLRVVGRGNQTDCWGPKVHAFWCRCLLIRVV